MGGLFGESSWGLRLVGAGAVVMCCRRRRLKPEGRFLVIVLVACMVEVGIQEGWWIIFYFRVGA